MSGDILGETVGNPEEEDLSFVEIPGILEEPLPVVGMLGEWETHHVPGSFCLNCFRFWAMMRSWMVENIRVAEMHFPVDIQEEDAGAQVGILIWPSQADLHHPYQSSLQTCHQDLCCRSWRRTDSPAMNMIDFRNNKLSSPICL